MKVRGKRANNAEEKNDPPPPPFSSPKKLAPSDEPSRLPQTFQDTQVREHLHVKVESQPSRATVAQMKIPEE